MVPVLSSTQLAPNVARLWIRTPAIARKRRPGQFVIVRVDELGERVPLTIADVDPERGAISLVVQAVGKTTRHICALRAGDTILDVAGPLGRPTHIRPRTRVCCVGGGIGMAVAYPIACGAKALHGRVTAIIGARRSDLIILEEDMRRVADEVIVTTDDGSRGRRGVVVDALRDLLDEGRTFDEVVAVGPVRMMEAISHLTRPLGLPTTVSLNPLMVDGTGMCGGCRVTVAGEIKFGCVDGPEFDGHHVDFGELNARLLAYREQERQASGHACRALASAVEPN